MKVVCAYLPHRSGTPIISLLDITTGLIDNVPGEIFTLQNTKTFSSLTGNYDTVTITSEEINILVETLMNGMYSIVCLLGSYDMFYMSKSRLVGETSGAYEHLDESIIFPTEGKAIGVVKCSPVTKDYFVAPQRLLEYTLSNGDRYWLTDKGFELAPIGVSSTLEMDNNLWSKYVDLARSEEDTVGYITLSGMPVSIKREEGRLTLK